MANVLRENIEKRTAQTGQTGQTAQAEQNDTVICHAAKQSHPEIVGVLAESEVLVLIFPLYVDGIPSHLLRLLDENQEAISEAASGALVYAVVNNGFYEADQNSIALDIVRNFAAKTGLNWGQGLAVGAGSLTGAAPIGRGPMKNLGRALNQLAARILQCQTDPDQTIEPNFPKFLYYLFANIGWRQYARKHGMKVKQLYDRT
jgi:hypothetical protein